MRIFLNLLVALLIAFPAVADGKRDHTHERGHDEHEEDHDRARRARELGEILPLGDILKEARQAYPGELIEAELEDEHGELVYKLVILSSDGRVLKLYYKAQSGKLLKMKERGKKH